MQHWLQFGIQIFVIGIILIFILYITLALIIKVISISINKIKYRRHLQDIFSIRREEITVGATAALAYHSGIISTQTNPEEIIMYTKHTSSAWNLTERINEKAWKNTNNWVKGTIWVVETKFNHSNAGRNCDEQQEN